MAESEIEDLGLKYREEVELENIVVTHTHVNRNDIYKLFASKIKKKSRWSTYTKKKTNQLKTKIGGSLWRFLPTVDEKFAPSINTLKKSHLQSCGFLFVVFGNGSLF